MLEASFFKYEGNFYAQTFGVPMGSLLSPVVANMVLEKVEKDCIGKLNLKNVAFVVFKRYVDDCFVIGRKEDIPSVMEEFNAAHPNLRFTLEEEKDHSIRFLD